MIVYTHDHIHLLSHDPAGASDFYKEMFDAQIVARRPDGRIELKLGGQMLFISPSTENSKSDGPKCPHSIDHFALAVSNLDQAVHELKVKGVTFTKELVTVRPGVRVAFVRGPDRINIELLQRS